MSSAPFSTDNVSVSETVIFSDGQSPVLIDNGADLFGADFQREGRDLLLRNADSAPIRIVDYFTHATPADLVAGNGGLLHGETVEILAGPIAPGQYAQARGPVAGLPIGQVETLDGTASVQRADGTVQVLQVGMKVFQNDVVATDAGSATSLTFVDGTIFSLAASSRMVLDLLIFDPDSTDNSGAFSLVQGSFVFIAGQVAKTGGMEITTPAATMGIRGTTVRVDVTSVGGETTVECSLNHDPDGGLGRIEIFDLDGNLLTTVTGTDFRWAITSAQDGLHQVLRTPEDLAHDAILLDSTFNAFTLAMRRVASGETFVDVPGRTRIHLPDANGSAGPEFDTGAGVGLSTGADGLPDLPATGGSKDAAPPPQPEAGPEIPSPPPPGKGTDDSDDTFLKIEEDTRYVGSLPKTDEHGDPLTYELVEDPEYGTVKIASDGGIVYDPEEDYSGSDHFAYATTDISGASDVTMAEVVVMPVNDAPLLTAAAFEVVETESLVIDLADFADDPDPEEDGTTLTYTITVLDDADPSEVKALAVDATDPAFGTFTVTGSILTFVPGEDFADLSEGETRVVAFDVTATDAAGASVTQVFSVTVTGVNDPPTLNEGALAAVEDGPAVQLDLAALASDAEGGRLTFALVTPPEKGTASLDGSLLSFAPGAAFQGLAPGETHVITLGVSATDDGGAVTLQEIAVTITGTNDVPVLSTATLSAVEDGAPVVLDLATLAADAEDGAAGLTYALVTPPEDGSASLDGSLLRFAPGAAFQDLAAGESRVITVGVSATDANGAVALQEIAVTVTGTNDAPVAEGALLVVAPGDALTGQVMAADVDGDALTYALVSDAAHGTVDLDPETGFYTYTATEGFSGADSFRVQVTDGQGGSDIATIDLAVATDSATGEDGQEVTIGIDDLGGLHVGASLGTPPEVNVAFVLDSSGSVGALRWAQQTANVADAIALLAARYEGSAVPVNVQVISYSNRAEATATYDLRTDSAALIADVLALDWRGGGTRWDLAFHKAERFFDGQSPDASNTVLFVTDGEATSFYRGALYSLTNSAKNGYSVDIHAFGIGPFPDMAALDEIDSDGAARTVVTPADLAAALTEAPVFHVELVDFQLRLVADRQDKGSVAGIDDLDLTRSDGTLAIAEIDGITALLGEENIFTATAILDFDGDLTTTDDQELVATVQVMGRSDAALDEEGSAASDLIFGSGFDDAIRGGDGNDLILGLEGDDLLKGGAGADQVLGGGGDDTIVLDARPDVAGENLDGGAGHDMLQIGFGGDLNDAMVPVAGISGIEVLDMENAAANTLELTLSDVLDVTDTGEAGIGALVAAATEPTFTIHGDAADTVTLTAKAGQDVEVSDAPPIFDSAGHEAVLYTFVDGAGEILASLAIDAEIAVHTAAPSA